MARTLLQSLQDRMKRDTPEQAAPGQTLAVQRIQRAGTGKAVDPRGPATSSLQERMAISQGEDRLQQIQDQEALQQEQQLQQQAEQTQAAEQARAGIAQGREQARESARQRMSELQQDLSQGRRQADFQDYAANLEQQGFLARLSNDQYINELTNEGRIKRLDDDLRFREEIKRSALDFASDDLYDRLGFARAADLDDDAFQRSLARIDLDIASRIAQEAAAAQQIQNIYSGATGAVSAGLEFAAQEGED